MDAQTKSNALSLNEAERRAERDAGKKRAEEIKTERQARHLVPPPTYALPLSDIDKPKLTLMSTKKDKDKTGQAKEDARDAASEDVAADDVDDEDSGGTAKADVIDPIKVESLNILEDMIDQTRRTKLAVKTQG